MSEADRIHWNQRYRAQQGPTATRANSRLANYARFVDLLAETRRNANAQYQALDIACGAGGTVLWLAARGWQALGVDLSEEAIALARAAAQDAELTGRARFVQADLDTWRPEPESVDLITVFFYLDRALLPALTAAVRPGGLLIYATFNHHRKRERPGTNISFLVRPGELECYVHGTGWWLLASHSDGANSPRPTDGIVAQRPFRAQAAQGIAQKSTQKSS